MSGVRWTTGVGIALGGVGGAVAALLGAPAQPAAPPVVKASVTSFPAPPALAPEPLVNAAPVTSGAPLAEQVATSTATPAVSTVPADPPTLTPAPLELPTTREALLRAEVLCDRKQQYDECSRAAESLEKGSAGETDPAQAKRFRKIALTYLVTECETGDPHACFVMAAKYRTGAELKASAVRAEALEKRGLELCRLRSAPECPAR